MPGFVPLMISLVLAVSFLSFLIGRQTATRGPEKVKPALHLSRRHMARYQLRK